jgi:formylglycine-generating enzyme required for sulfatase activity/serine/threonine protein kinase
MTEDSLALVGTTVADKYEVEAVVGLGGFAIVYRARHQLWKRPVALKVFKALQDLPESVREELTASFIREGALLAELSEKSTAICQARDVGVLVTPSGHSLPYMVLEWLEGASLEEVLEGDLKAGARPRTLFECVRLLDPIAEALALAHVRGIAHRDVKPANIFVLGDPRAEHCPVKLLDFGIAKVVQDIQKAEGAFAKTSGTITSFTPAYAAPEQFSRSHGSTGPWTDVFALALVVVECVTSRAPLEGDDLVQLGYASADRSRRPTPRAFGLTTSDDVEAVFQKALAVDTSARFESAGLFWNDLRRVMDLGPSSLLSQLEPSSRAPAPPSAARVVIDTTGQTLAVPSGAAGPASPLPVVDATSPSAVRAPASRVPFAIAAVALLVGAVVAVRFLGAASPAATPIVTATSASAAPPASASAAPRTACPDGMVFIPGAESAFIGSDDGQADEKPAHKVRLAPYCMDTFEVTTKKYMDCVLAGDCSRAPPTNEFAGLKDEGRKIYDPLCNASAPEAKAQHPINCVSWQMAKNFCGSFEKRGRRLPTEAEWEFAARGKANKLYPWGEEAPSAHYLNACGLECIAWAKPLGIPMKPMYNEDDHWPATAPVGSFPRGASPFGVMDLAGNVWEWVSDWYGPYSAGDGEHPVAQPTGPATGQKKVIRGGAFNGSDPSWERPSYRYDAPPEDRNFGIGFRCVSDPTEPRP